jgi:hypothetical protein
VVAVPVVAENGDALLLAETPGDRDTADVSLSPAVERNA